MTTESTVPVTISVRKHHIEEADRGLARSCMVAQAFRQQLDVDQQILVNVGFTSIQVARGRTIIRASLPTNVSRKILRWDKGKNLRPFDFTVEFPADWRERLNDG